MLNTVGMLKLMNWANISVQTLQNFRYFYSNLLYVNVSQSFQFKSDEIVFERSLIFVLFHSSLSSKMFFVLKCFFHFHTNVFIFRSIILTQDVITFLSHVSIICQVFFGFFFLWTAIAPTNAFMKCKLMVINFVK